MKRIAIAAALLMMTTTLPVALGSHLSTGALTTYGMSAEESPRGPRDPSVEGTTVGDKSTPYGVGTSADCYNADAEVSAEEPQAAATAEAVCGDLLYNEGTPFQRPSPPDQDIPKQSPIGTFDAQIGYSQPGGFLWRTCQPWCLDRGTPTDNAVGNLTWDAFHTAGEAAGITAGPDKSDEEDNGRYQIITNDVTTPNAFHALQRQTEVWEMNGWSGPPSVMERAVAFIYNDQGKFVNSTMLNEYIDEAIANDQLSGETKYRVCGMNPGTEYDSSQAQTFCEIRFTDQPSGDDGVVDPTADGYDDKCNSPTYICAADGPYWRSYNVGLAGSFSNPGVSFGEPGSAQSDVHHLHFVIAPNPHECPNVMPNHLDFDGDTGSLPYLAHDLDVYTPPTELSDGPQVSSDGLQDYADALSSDTPSVPSVPASVADTVDGAASDVVEQTDPFTESDTIEPNNGEAVSGIPDNSRTAIVEPRSEPTDCQSLVDSETSETRDPWVNVLDAKVEAAQDPALETGYGAYQSERAADHPDPETDGAGDYGNADRDASNRPGPSFYRTTGKIGVFADKNDDGDYDQNVGTEGVWQADDIQSTGAYPMMWDMRIDEDAEEPTNSRGGCPTGPGGSFSAEMAGAGYGPNTALVQAIYLREPTVFTNVNPVPIDDGTVTTDDDAQDPQQVPFPGGNNIYVLANDAGRDLWDGDTSADAGNTVDRRVDGLVSDLRAHVQSEYGVSDVGVEEPGAQLGRNSDYDSQCGEDTGGFTGDLSFQHSCQAVSCEGDTIATMYTFEVNGTDLYGPTLGSDVIPPLKIGEKVYEFGSGQHTWYDVDPFDNDPSRNTQQQSPPPTGS